MLAQLEEEFGDDLQFIYRHFPLSIHDKAQLATQAAEAAGLQGKFWEMHDLMFQKQEEWAELSIDDFQDWVTDQADELGLDTDQFTGDMESQELVDLAQAAYDHNLSIGMPGTPFLMINNVPYQGPSDYGNLSAVFKTILLEKQQYAECPSMDLDPDKEYYAILHTEKGDITLELYADRTPLAVNNFIFLSRQGWYDGVTFHRVIPGFVAQAGDPSGTGFGGPGYAFDNEAHPDLKFDGPGVLGMANAGPGSNGSQFFITYAPAPNLDEGFTIFGRVISGMEVVESLALRDPSQSMDLPPGDAIISISIEEK